MFRVLRDFLAFDALGGGCARYCIEHTLKPATLFFPKCMTKHSI